MGLGAELFYTVIVVHMFCDLLIKNVQSSKGS
jgi:hypothetical protein